MLASALQVHMYSFSRFKLWFSVEMSWQIGISSKHAHRVFCILSFPYNILISRYLLLRNEADNSYYTSLRGMSEGLECCVGKWTPFREEIGRGQPGRNNIWEVALNHPLDITSCDPMKKPKDKLHYLYFINGKMERTQVYLWYICVWVFLLSLSCLYSARFFLPYVLLTNVWH